MLKSFLNRHILKYSYSQLFTSISNRVFRNPSKIFFTTVTIAPLTKIDKETIEGFDLKLRDACAEGEKSIIALTNLLKENITEISIAYKHCLTKQIEILDEARWDDLPEYRVMALELNEKFENFASTVQILGQIAQNSSLNYITEQEWHFKLLEIIYKQLDNILKHQREEIKILENRLLIKTRESIEKTKLFW